MITQPLWRGLWQPLWGVGFGERVLAMLVDPNDGTALTDPVTGEAWVQWITVTDNG